MRIWRETWAWLSFAFVLVGCSLPASYLSPDKQWRVEMTRFDCALPGNEITQGSETLRLARAAVADAILMDSQQINCGGLGAYGLAALLWSPNSRYFYYTPARTGVPDGCGYWLPPVKRLDVHAGTTHELGGGVPSPDGTRLAVWSDQALALWDINGGELGRWPTVDPDSALAAVAWSPDSRAVAYLLSPLPCGPNAAGKSYVVRIAVDLSQSVLLETEAAAFATLAWDSRGTIRLTDRQGAQWTLDDTGLQEPAAP
jgi:WD40 repeat protein